MNVLQMTSLPLLGILLLGCGGDDTQDATGQKAHYAIALGIISIDSFNLGVSTQTTMVYADDDIYDGLGVDISDHIILENASQTLEIHLSKDCQSITSFTYKDESNITYNDFSALTYSCTKIPTDITVYDLYDPLLGEWDYALTSYDVSIEGALTNNANDVVQIIDGMDSVGILEVEYTYSF